MSELAWSGDTADRLADYFDEANETLRGTYTHDLSGFGNHEGVMAEVLHRMEGYHRAFSRYCEYGRNNLREINEDFQTGDDTINHMFAQVCSRMLSEVDLPQGDF